MSSAPSYKDSELLASVAKGDETAFSQLFLQYKDRVYSTAYRITESNVEAEEIVQDVFVKIWTKKESLTEIENLDAYVFTMAKNHTFNALKRLLRERERTNGWPIDKELSIVAPEVTVNGKEFQAILKKAIDRLPPQQRQVYQLIKNEELTKVEVAEILGISPNTVKTHFDAAVRSIRAICLPYMELYLLLFIFS